MKKKQPKPDIYCLAQVVQNLDEVDCYSSITVWGPKIRARPGESGSLRLYPWPPHRGVGVPVWIPPGSSRRCCPSGFHQGGRGTTLDEVRVEFVALMQVSETPLTP